MTMAPYRSWVEVSRERIAENFRAVRDTVGQEVEVMPVVKADAYRHGAEEVSRVLEVAGAKWLAVSSVEEGVSLRQSGIGTRILVMADFLPCEREALIDNRLTPAIHSLGDVHDLDRLAATRGIALPFHLKIDSGMGRLGTQASAAQILEVISSARNAHCEGLMTHFASAALYSTNQTAEQLAYYEGIVEALHRSGCRPRYSHLSATIPIAYGHRAAWGNMVRPGHAIYGYVSPVRGSAPRRLLDVKPALEWKAAILETKNVPAGAPIGYGAIYRAKRPMRIGILSVGYADGLPHRLSNRGQVIAAGQLVPILGAVSMDLTTVDLSETPSLQVGDSVKLLGEADSGHIDAQQIARIAGTISYSVLCGISARVKRVYI
jgi:alanine racemase